MRALAWLSRRFEELLSGVALVVIVAAVCWGVLTRYITETPAAWAGEVGAIAFSWLIFVGAAAGFKYQLHISIDLLVRFVPARWRRWLTALVDLLVLVFLGYLSWLALHFTVSAWGDPTPVLRLPRSVGYASVLVGALCMAGRYGGLAWRRWRGRPGPLLELPRPLDA